jgi:replicative DNA helicase
VKLGKSLSRFKDFPFYFWDEGQKLTFKRFEETLAYAVADYGVKLVVIDHGLYFQLASTYSSNRSGEVGDLVRALKQTAQTLKVPLLVLWHTKRLEKGRRVPTISDLRESSMVEKDADVVAFVVRDYLAGTATCGTDAYVHVEKNRTGPVGKAMLEYDVETTRFSEIVKVDLNTPTTLPAEDAKEDININEVKI